MLSFFTRIIKSVGRLVRERWKLLLVLLIVVGVIAFWRYQVAQASKPKLTFEHPTYRDITKKLEVTGVVDAKEKASMRFAVGGKVAYVGAKEGDLVRKWQTIATIDQRELQKKLKQDLNSYMQERWNREEYLDEMRIRALPKKELRDVDQEQWELENTVLDVEIRDIAIKNTHLSAPFDGILVKSPASVPGINLLATDTFDVINPQTLIFRAAVDESDIGLVVLGKLGHITLDAYPDEPFTSSVSYIDVKSSQSSTGTVFVVELPLMHDQELRRLKLGMNGDVDIVIEEKKNVLTVPLIATRQREDKLFVDIRTGETAVEERVIEPGLETDEYIEVLSGLSEQDEIVIPED